MAVRVRFLAGFDFSPGAHRGRVTIAYRAGWTGLVNEDCARIALAAGTAERVDRPHPAPIAAPPEPDDAETTRRRSVRARRL
ncbi:MAG: hypothetical protein ACK4TL_18510 [Hyphomicrobiaceae bacterium]